MSTEERVPDLKLLLDAEVLLRDATELAAEVIRLLYDALNALYEQCTTPGGVSNEVLIDALWALECARGNE